MADPSSEGLAIGPGPARAPPGFKAQLHVPPRTRGAGGRPVSASVALRVH